MGVFLPKQENRGERMRWCKTCCRGPMRSKDTVKYRQGPVDFHFCKIECATFFLQHRYEPGLRRWFKRSATERHLSSEVSNDTPSSSNSTPGLRDLHYGDVPMSASQQLSLAALFSQCGGSNSDSAV